MASGTNWTVRSVSATYWGTLCGMPAFDPYDVHQRRSCGHKNYHLTCHEFGALEALARGRCALCARLPVQFLCLDHDHAVGARAIRGLVCQSCNEVLANVDRGYREPDDRIVEYLANPWYQAMGMDGSCPARCRNREHWADQRVQLRIFKFLGMGIVSGRPWR